MREALPRVTATLIRKAEAGDIRALRLVGDWLGFGRKGGPSVQVAVDARGVPDEEQTIEELLAERARMAEIVDDYIDRHREDAEEQAPPGDTGAS